MHVCAHCAEILIQDTSNRGELSMNECAQCAEIFILDTSNREELSLYGCTNSSTGIIPL
jgi:glutamyl-tRNA reductase